MTSTKKLFTTTAAAAAIATGALATTTVHADADTPEGNSQSTSQAPATSQATAQDKLANAQAALQSQQASQAAAMPQQLADKQAELTQQAQPRVDSENASYQQAVASQQAANSQAVANASQNITTPLQKQTLTAQENQLYSQKTQKLDAEHQQHLDGLKSAYDAQASQLNSQIQSQQTSEQQAHDQAIKDANAKLDSQIKDAQTSVDNLQSAVNNDQTEVTNAQNAVNQAQSQVDSATKALNDAKGDSQTDYANDFPKYNVRVKDGEDHLLISHDAVNWHDNNPADQREVTLDADGRLTGQDAKEAAIFAANIINHIRTQVGTKPVKVSQDAIDIAIKGSQLFDQPGVNEGDNEVVSTAEQAASGINHGRIFFDHDFNSGVSANEHTTMAEIKETINQSILDYLQEYTSGTDGHRRSIFGNGPWYPLMNNQYVAFNFAGKKGIDMLWFMDLNNQHDLPLAGNGSFVDNTAALTSALNSAKSALSSANSRLTSAKAKLTKDTDSLNAAKTTLATLKGTARPGDTSADTDSPAVKALKGKLSALTSTYQANVKKENDAYNQAKAKLTKDHQARLDQIKNKPENVDDVKAQNQKALDTLKKNHEAKLAAIKADITKQLEAYKQQLIAENAKKNQPLVDEINVLKTEINKPAESGQVSDVVNGDKDSYVTKDGKVISVTSNNTAITSPKNVAYVAPTAKDSSLPQTGNNDSIALVALGAVASMLGLGLAKKREY